MRCETKTKQNRTRNCDKVIELVHILRSLGALATLVVLIVAIDLGSHTILVVVLQQTKTAFALDVTFWWGVDLAS